MNLRGKTALVTGGAHRIGRAIVLMLAGAGAHVAVNYHTSEQSARLTVSHARARGVTAGAFACDVADSDAVQQMLDEISNSMGGVDILINNAGLFRPTPLPSGEPALWRQVVDTSIYGTFYVTNALIPSLQARQGAVINVLDGIIYRPWRDFSAHAVAKAGMLALTRQLAGELAPTVRVNAVALGPVLPPDHLGREKYDHIAKGTLLQRWGTPDDVVAAVRFLLEADYATGEVLTIDGGERYGR